MRQFGQESARSSPTGVVDVARWEQFSLGQALPFGAMWYTVPPGTSSPQDCHPESELSIVLRGTASVETGGELTDVTAGSAFLLDSGEAHIIHNKSADQPLLVFSSYWMPQAVTA